MENDNIRDEIDPWGNEAFLKELQSRIDDFESGKTNSVSWEEVTRRAEAEFNKRHNNSK